MRMCELNYRTWVSTHGSLLEGKADVERGRNAIEISTETAFSGSRSASRTPQGPKIGPSCLAKTSDCTSRFVSFHYESAKVGLIFHAFASACRILRG
jgi:hypothetical protein